MSLVNEITRNLLPEEEKKKVVAVYGGGFKPPTSGHFEVVQQALKENPEIDEFIIFIGGKERDGISPEDSILIWDIYKTYLPYKVEVKYTSSPPIKSVYNYAKEHPNEEVLFVIGAREGNEEDFKDISSRTTSLDKYPNLNLRTVVTQGGVSGTAARNAAKISFEKFRPFVPSELSDEEAQEVFNIVSQSVQELLNENASYSQNIDLKREIAKLTKHMIDKGMNIQPLPKLVFKNGDSENAKQFLGKTAYYDPNNQSIVLYTEGRHPKDIVRSFSHEMVHHTQFLENRLGNITTTNTQEDDNLDKLEQEANLKGTMTFRNWTDSLNEVKKGVDNSIVAVLSRNGHQISLYDFKNKEPLGLINTYGNEVTGVVAKKGYGPLMYELGMANVYPNGLQSDRHGNTEPAAEAVWKKYIAGASPNIKVEKLTPKDRDYRTTYAGDGYDSSFIPDFYNYKFYNPNTAILKNLLEKGNKLPPDEQKQIILSTEEMYDGAVNEAIVGEKIECDKCNWSWNIVDGGDDLFICHKCGHDNTPLQEKKNKDPFGINAYAMELGKLREEEKDYKIYVDMDGVVADFDQRFRDLAGMGPREFEEKYGKNAFWDFIDEGDNKLVFWVGIPPMSDAKQLIDYVSKYDYEMLTAPSLKKQSLMGKGLWMKNQTNKGLFPSKPKVNYKSAKNKKDFAAPNNILIDDREDTINSWNAAGGIGILHTSAASTISQLKKLGL